MEKVKMLASVISHMPLHFVWQYSGVCEEEGFELEVDVSGLSIEGRPAVPMSGRADGLLSGDYAFVSGLHHKPYELRTKGERRLTYLAQAQNDWDDRLVVAPGVRTLSDLEGQAVFVSTRSRCTFGNFVGVLENVGVDTDRIEFVSPEQRTHRAGLEGLAAIEQGHVRAALLDLPFDKLAEAHDWRPLALPALPVIHNATICTNGQWAWENREIVVRFLRSMVRAIHYFKNNPDRVVKILAERLAPLVGVEGDEVLRHWQAGWAELLSPKPYPHPLAVWNVYQLDVGHDASTDFLSPLEPWDLSYLNAALSDDLAASLYGSEAAARAPAVTPQIFAGDAKSRALVER